MREAKNKQSQREIQKNPTNLGDLRAGGSIDWKWVNFSYL